MTEFTISNTSITFYGLPTMKEMMNALTYLESKHPGQYDSHHIRINLFRPLETKDIEIFFDSIKVSRENPGLSSRG